MQCQRIRGEHGPRPAVLDVEVQRLFVINALGIVFCMITLPVSLELGEARCSA